MAITADDVIVGHVYEAKRKEDVFGLLNDRQVLWVDALRDAVQYDSPTVRNGRQYPKTKMSAFVKWAARDITDIMPKGEWRKP